MCYYRGRYRSRFYTGTDVFIGKIKAEIDLASSTVAAQTAPVKQHWAEG